MTETMYKMRARSAALLATVTFVIVGIGTASCSAPRGLSNPVPAAEPASIPVSGPASISTSEPLEASLQLMAIKPPTPDPCAQYYGKGYCVDYVRAKLTALRKGTPPGNPAAWPKDSKTPMVGSAALLDFARPYGHVAWVESVDTKNKMFSVSQWNFGNAWINASCAVTNMFGKVNYSTYSFTDPRVLGFYYPSKH